jgi:GrpB-like predicted nucleotidyltransferase (UPF0157 family)
MSDQIIISDHNPNWPKIAELEISFLKSILSEFTIDIEHIGSTAIPNLASKPIIDLMIGLQNLEQADQVIHILEKNNYSYWQENPFKEHFFFVKRLSEKTGSARSHHVHVVQKVSGGINFYFGII